MRTIYNYTTHGAETEPTARLTKHLPFKTSGRDLSLSQASYRGWEQETYGRIVFFIVLLKVLSRLSEDLGGLSPRCPHKPPTCSACVLSHCGVLHNLSVVEHFRPSSCSNVLTNNSNNIIISNNIAVCIHIKCI